MAFLDRVLDAPSYGYVRDGRLHVPSTRELLREFFSRLNVVRTRKSWLCAWCWFATLALFVPLGLFLRFHLDPWLVALGFLYSMVALGTHGTIWFHRYSTHRAYTFRNAWLRTLCRNLVIKIVPEEVYVVSHHVHHARADQAGDPYNAAAGFLYCFLADANHQGVNRDLSEDDYRRTAALLKHTGVRLNSYRAYQRWGSLCHPAWTIAHYALNWAFWYAAFFVAGGHPLALALFGSAAIWAVGIRTFNFAGHGSGHDQRQDGVDFHRADMSVNQLWPGYVAGEWHNNHHLYPRSARSGFLPYQLDLAWWFIRSCAWLGIVSSYRDDKAVFERDHLQPWAAREALAALNDASRGGGARS
ncbi:MAG TPA: fatty acid desaturase [Polyangiales bacterium]